MQLTHDQVSDAAYVYFTKNDVARTEELSDRVSVDYDSNDEVVGVEFLGVSDGIDLEDVPRRAEVAKLLGHFKVYA